MTALLQSVETYGGVSRLGVSDMVDISTAIIEPHHAPIPAPP